MLRASSLVPYRDWCGRCRSQYFFQQCGEPGQQLRVVCLEQRLCCAHRSAFEPHACKCYGVAPSNRSPRDNVALRNVDVCVAEVVANLFEAPSASPCSRGQMARTCDEDHVNFCSQQRRRRPGA